MEFQKVLNYATYFAVRLFICLVQAVRLETCERLADLLATIATDVIPLRRKLIDDNLRHAFPELDERRRRAPGQADVEASVLACGRGGACAAQDS